MAGRFERRANEREAAIEAACDAAEALLINRTAADDTSGGEDNGPAAAALDGVAAISVNSAADKGEWSMPTPPVPSVAFDAAAAPATPPPPVAAAAAAREREAEASSGSTGIGTACDEWEGKLIDWSVVPPSLDPAGGELGAERAQRKRQQIEALLEAVVPVVDWIANKTEDGDEIDTGPDAGPDAAAKRRDCSLSPVHVVDFGAGSGHAGLLLAWLRPEVCFVSLLERKAYSCDTARRRAEEAGLSNARVRCEALHEFATGGDDEDRNGGGGFGSGVDFDLGISLHSCGLLTDGALELCMVRRAAFVLCPCCYGRVNEDVAGSGRAILPRSRVFSRMERRAFAGVASAADFSVPASDVDFVRKRNFRIAKRCMRVVDADRTSFAAEHGYAVRITSLFPLNCTPKNNLIVGWSDPERRLVGPQPHAGGGDGVGASGAGALELSGMSAASSALLATAEETKVHEVTDYDTKRTV